MLPLVPGYQEISRMMGVALDKNMATVGDYLIPLPTSGARLLNALGDPVKTPNDLQRVIQSITAGTYPFSVDPVQSLASAGTDTAAYAALFASSYVLPTINPGKGYAIGGQYRPMTQDELARYTALRGEKLKAELAALGSLDGVPQDEARKAVQAAYQRANSAALAEVGVTTPTRASAASGSATAGASGAVSMALPGGSRRLGTAPASTRTLRFGRAPMRRVAHGRVSPRRLGTGPSLRLRKTATLRRPSLRVRGSSLKLV
jgi:hypothetical protein